MQMDTGSYVMLPFWDRQIQTFSIEGNSLFTKTTFKLPYHTIYW